MFRDVPECSVVPGFSDAPRFIESESITFTCGKRTKPRLFSRHLSTAVFKVNRNVFFFHIGEKDSLRAEVSFWHRSFACLVMTRA